MSCTWPVDHSCLPEATTDGEKAKLQASIDTAVGILWALTGRQFGCCPVIARPCPEGCDTSYGALTGTYAGATWYPMLDGGQWRNAVCGCGSACRAVGPNVVHLQGPICEVVEVKIGATVLAPEDYRLEGDRLYRVGSDWPTQDLRLPLDDAGTWSVTYLQGRQPPAGAPRMAALIAKEVWSACNGGKCRLPSRVTQVTRQGVTMSMPNPADVTSAGYTGVAEVDLWISAHNPNHLTRPPQVGSPDWLGGA